MKVTCLCSAISLALIVAQPLCADFMTFNDEGDFLTAAGATELESFEDLVATNALDSITIVTDNFVISTSTGDPDIGIFDISNAGAFATDGSNYVSYQSGENESIVFTFDNEINAFGLDITDYGDFGSGNLTFSNSAGDMAVAGISGTQNGDQIFFGAVNTDFAFDTVTFTNTILGEGFGVDKIYSAGSTVVPEPASVSVLLVGGLCLLRRNRVQR